MTVKKLKDEKALFKQALEVGMKYAQQRATAEFAANDSVDVKAEYIYRLLVHDKVIQPLPADQVSQQAIRHRLAVWISGLKR